MKKAIAVTVLILGAWALMATLGRGKKAGTGYGPGSGITAESPGDRSFKDHSLRDVEIMLSDWPPRAKRAARVMVEKYGVPDEWTRKKVAWNDNGPWKRTIVRRDDGADVLEQVAAYRVASARFDVIRHLEGNISAERGRDELSAKADSEPLNFLSLNLAEEVLSGKRDAEDARRFFKRTAELAASGKSSPYTEALLFAEPAPPQEEKKP